MRTAVGYLLGAAVSFTGGLADLAYINVRLVPHVLDEVSPIEELAAPAPAAVPAAAPEAPPALPPAPPAAELRYERAGIVRFKTGSARLSRRSRAELVRIAEQVRARPELLVRADGHADVRGHSSYNQGLSERRAARVAAELARLGVGRERIEVRAFGEQQAGNEWFLDRRVEISIGGRFR